MVGLGLSFNVWIEKHESTLSGSKKHESAHLCSQAAFPLSFFNKACIQYSALQNPQPSVLLLLLISLQLLLQNDRLKHLTFRFDVLLQQRGTSR